MTAVIIVWVLIANHCVSTGQIGEWNCRAVDSDKQSHVSVAQPVTELPACQSDIYGMLAVTTNGELYLCAKHKGRSRK